MEKKIYQAPYTEQIYMDINGQLLDDGWSAWKVGGGGTNTPEAKRNILDDDFDFLDDEETGINWSFNVWE